MEILKKNIYKAFNLIDFDPSVLKGRTSSTYDLVYEGKKYPPILVLSIANTMNGGKELFLEDFKNGTTEAFKYLTDFGFEIIKKEMVKNNKEKFELWLSNNMNDNSGANSSYMRSLLLLEDSFYKNGKIQTKSIFDINDVSKIKDLYKETIEIQRDRNSYIYRKETPSYGDKGFFSASLKKYIDFLSDNSISFKMQTKIESESFDFKTFHQCTKDAGLIFSEKIVARFVASLCTKPFVICSGLSGSGKTKLAQAFAQWICYKEAEGEKNEQYCIVPVGADWTNREPLLGYPNALQETNYVKPENGVLDLINRARLNENKPYFLILDEMNLSHVERYFADFLSTMESGDAIPLHTIEEEEKTQGGIPKKINLPNNLFIIGTVNIDETTYMFSPKVLDRANTIEFRLTEKDLKDFIASDVTLDMDLLKGEGESMGESFVKMAIQKTDKNLKDAEDDLIKFFKELKKSGAEFGYRTAGEMGRLMFMLKLLGQKDDNLLDIAIMQKLLPKLHGSRNKLSKVLPVLGGFCLAKNAGKIKEDYLDKFANNTKTEEELMADPNIKYPISFEKICRMYKNAIENGFASYAEA